jgi:hypothetical protein
MVMSRPAGLFHGTSVVGLHDPVVQRAQDQRLPAAIGRSGDADAIGAHQSLVGQQAREVLRVVRLVAGIGEPDPAALHAHIGIAQRGVGRARGRSSARLAEAARRVADDDVAGDRPVHERHVRLRQPPAVQIEDERKRPGLIGGRQRDVDVERHAVEALDARPQLALAELHAVARDARDVTAEDRCDRRGGRAMHRIQRQDEHQQADGSHGGGTYGSRPGARKHADAGDRRPRVSGWRR